MRLYFRKIQKTNARSSVRFCPAVCETKLRFPAELPCVPAGIVFGPGIYILHKYCETRLLPKKKQKKRAGLTSEISQLSTMKKTGRMIFFTEKEWVVIIAQHLLSKLVDETYLMDSNKNYGNILEHETCSCKEKDRLVGEVNNDTTFGCEKVWHGSTNILLGLPIIVREEKDNLDEVSSVHSFDSISSMEGKKTKFSSQDEQEILAKTIV